MATSAIRSYTSSFSSLRGLTRKTVGVWQDPDGASSHRQQFISHGRATHSSPTRHQNVEERSSDSSIADNLRKRSQSCGLQYAKFHGHLEKITKSAGLASPKFESCEVSRWPAKVYRTINWAMKLEPVLRQMADFNFEFRPTASLLSLGSRDHAFRSSVIGLDLNGVLHRHPTVSSDGAEAVDPAGTLTALLEELCLELAEFRAELCHAMDSLHGGKTVQRIQKRTASRSVMRPIIRDCRPAKGVLYGEMTRLSFWSKLREPQANLQRASIHSLSFGSHPEKLKSDIDPLEMLLFGRPLDLSFWSGNAPLMASIQALVTLDTSTPEDVYLDHEGPNQESNGKSCDTCNAVDPRQVDYSLSPYIQMFGQIHLQDILQLATEKSCRHSASQPPKQDTPISEHLASGDAQIPTKGYSNNTISGSARVHLGDLYYENVTINQYYVVRDFNEPLLEPFATLENVTRNFNHIT